MENKLIPYQATSCISASSVVVFAPHPDDEVFGCGGTIMSHVAAGVPVRVVIVSDGAFHAEDMEGQALLEIREAESRKAAVILGYGEPEFWRLPDHGIEYGEALIERLIQTMEAHQDGLLVYTPSLREMHPDHRQLAMATVEAMRRLGGNSCLAMYEVGIPLQQPNVLLDISDLLDRKRAAITCFVSQLKLQHYDRQILALNSYRAYTLPKEVAAAEAYQLVTSAELAQDPLLLYQPEYARQHTMGLPQVSDDLPLVSIMIRSMNRPTLREALDSVSLQTYSNIEVVVVAACGQTHPALGKTCGRFPLRLEFAPDGNSLLRPHAANLAMERAKGAWLIFLDDDDMFDPEHIAILIQALHKHPHTKVVYTGVRMEDNEGNVTGSFNFPYDQKRLLATNFIPIHALLFSRDLIGEAGAHFDENMNVYEDWDFWLQLARRTPFLHINKISAVYRALGNSGAGLTVDNDLQQQSREQLFDKWRLLWTGKDINRIAQYLFELERKIAEHDAVVAERNAVVVAERNAAVAERNAAVAGRDEQIINLNRTLAASNQHTHNLRQVIEETHNSSSWRITAPMRQLSSKAKNILSLLKLLPSIIHFGGGMTKSGKKAWRVFSREGWTGVKRRILFVGGHRSVNACLKIRPDSALPEVDRNDYTEWLRRYDTLTDADRATIASKIAGFQAKPLISVVMPVYNPPVLFFEQALQSVRNQLYQNWELCIADDASTNPAVREILERHCREDHRIKAVYREQNGHISLASNSAIELAQGEFIALFDQDDLLTEHALYCVVNAINQHPDVGLLYSDEDKVDESNRRYQPYFKCGLNYELLLAQNIVSHLGVYRTDIVRTLGAFREGFEGAQDYDLVLRVIEKLQPDQVIHIPRVLYHWRAIAGSTALAEGEKKYAAGAGRKAVEEHLKRTGLAAEVMPAPEASSHNRIRFFCPSPQPLVSIIIPTRDRADLLGMCLDSLIQRTTYSNYEIIIIDNGSVEDATQQLFDRQPKDRVTILRDESPFNFSVLNNKAARAARGELLCLMNNDIEILTPDWLEEMVSFAARQDIGCVGARLWYPDGRLQHGGCVVGLGGVCGHSHKYLRQGDPGYFYRAVLHQSFSAVTAACLLVRRSVFEEVDGLDEQLGVAFNDVDFCLRVHDAGYRNVWTPYAEMNHHESASRGAEDTPAKRERFLSEIRFFQSHWGKKLLNDSAYSPNLTLDYEDFSYAWPPRISPI
jgi:glycosyltransferase involved in cell wall biosynthesis/LmbE family N-acetylglucosaminyl deacetylase